MRSWRFSQEISRSSSGAKTDLDKYASLRHDVDLRCKNESAVGSTIEQIATVLGGIDALINNAGEIVVGPLDAMGRERF